MSEVERDLSAGNPPMSDKTHAANSGQTGPREIVEFRVKHNEGSTIVICETRNQVHAVAREAARFFGLDGDLWTLAIPERDNTVFAQTAYVSDLLPSQEFTLHELEYVDA